MDECGRNVVEEENLIGAAGDEQKSSMASHLRRQLWKDVDPDQSSIPLTAYCFMTGFMCVQSSILLGHEANTGLRDAITFTAVSVWCGFQTVSFRALH